MYPNVGMGGEAERQLLDNNQPEAGEERIGGGSQIPMRQDDSRINKRLFV
jgi:hypothetical protein